MVFSGKLIRWYHANKRQLSWRETKDVYKIWISEVILQQTRVEQGLSYYNHLIDRYPDIFKLASAGEEELLKLWQGLGYYSRARNMLAAAKDIVEDHNGVFPDTLEEIIKIKGIGRYTGSAILSFAYNLPYPVVDGNVKRVITRYFGINYDIKLQSTLKFIEQKLNTVFDKKNAADFNQAIMEFGALHCRAGIPACGSCIFRNECQAFKTGKVAELPLISKRIPLKIRCFYFMVPVIEIKGKQFTYIEKRESDDIWKHLFQFPLIETEKELSPEKLFRRSDFSEKIKAKKFEVLGLPQRYSHKLSHQHIRAVFIRLRIYEPLKTKGLIKVGTDEINSFPVSVLTGRYITQHDFLMK